MPRNSLRLLAFALMVTLSASLAVGCPLCETGTGRQVRATIWSSDPLRSLIATVAPFGLLLAAAGWIHLTSRAGKSAT